MFDVEEDLRRQARMESERSNFEALWHEIGQLILPRQADFLGSTSFSQGARRTEHIYDETAMMALDHGCAVFEGEVIPAGAQWQIIMGLDPELMKNQRARLWFELKTSQLFQLRNSAYSGFGNQTHESVASLLAFGLQGMAPALIRDGRGVPVGIGYRSEHIGQLYIQENYRGEIDIVHRKFTLTNRQALQQWDDKAPECARKGERDGRLDDANGYIHVLRPNPAFDPARIDAAGKQIASYYIAVADRQAFDQGGYRSMPTIVSRYEKSPTETYGRSPAINVLPSIKATQAMMRDLVTAIEFMAGPALLAHSDMQDEMLFYAPRSVSYGGLDDRGNPTVRRMFEDPDISAAMKLLEDTRGVIKRAFFEDLYTVRQDLKSHITAFEMMDRAQQRGLLLAPLQRQETEWLTPMAHRELDLMNEIGLLDDMPPEVAEAGGLYQTIYENPLARARKAEGAAGFYNMLNGLSALMQLDPVNTVPEFFRRYPFGKVVAGLGQLHAVPVAWEASEDEQKAAAAEARALADKAKLIEVGTAAAGIAKDIAAAAAAGGAHAA
ncbi:MAG TPA: portal protein [Allosphingosinicella sp.]|nr:portal protein [Allosphingosinicella sp.]